MGVAQCTSEGASATSEGTFAREGITREASTEGASEVTREGIAFTREGITREGITREASTEGACTREGINLQ